MIYRYIVVLFLIIVNVVFTSTRKLSRVDRIEVCDVSPNSALRVNEIIIKNPEGANVLVNINATILRELRAEVRFEITITRCLNKETLDTCEPFTTLKPLSTCALIAMGNMAWSDLVNAIHPPMRCPFKTGDYTVTNGTLDAEKFSFFPIDNYYWKVKILMIEDKQDFIAVCADLRAINVQN